MFMFVFMRLICISVRSDGTVDGDYLSAKVVACFMKREYVVRDLTFPPHGPRGTLININCSLMSFDKE